tara:strand:+ start:26 stop:358 length:333 start_codon:yes stop_codon:yes gene_type:complete
VDIQKEYSTAMNILEYANEFIKAIADGAYTEGQEEEGNLRDDARAYFYNNFPTKEKVMITEIDLLIGEIDFLNNVIEHDKSCRLGLWATDRPDLLNNEERDKCFLFEITN